MHSYLFLGRLLCGSHPDFGKISENLLGEKVNYRAYTQPSRNVWLSEDLNFANRPRYLIKVTTSLLTFAHPHESQ